MPERKLTPRQERFIQEYLIDLNATQAAIRAGYSKRTARKIGCENLTKPDIRAEIDKAQTDMAKKAELTQQFVLNGLKENLKRALQHQAVLDHDGNKTGEYRYDGGVANRALELLGKHLGMFKDKVEHSGTLGLGDILQELDGRSRDRDQEQAGEPPLAH